MSEISVIIPVYNVENYLSKCLDSVCNQTFNDIEIICVNDGSDDDSLEILMEYVKKDKRIKVFTQTNEGLGSARNKGLKAASGNYIYFMDSDDCIDPKTLEKLHKSITDNGSDIVLFKFQKFNDNKNVHTRGIHFRIDEILGDIDYSNYVFNYKDVKMHVMNTAFSPCLKLFRKDFLDSYEDFIFQEGVSFEDVLFHIKVMMRASKISFVNESLYYYRSNPHSILNSTANGMDIFTIIDSSEDFLRDNGYYEEMENEFIFFKIAQILLYLFSTDSEEYFNIAKQKFMNLEIKDETTLKKYALEGYYRVLDSPTFSDYKLSYYKGELSKLKKQNRKLRRKNRKLKRISRKISNSKAFKLSKSLRFF